MDTAITLRKKTTVSTLLKQPPPPQQKNNNKKKQQQQKIQKNCTVVFSCMSVAPGVKNSDGRPGL